MAYVQAGGIDQPLEIVRMDVEQPFSGIPHANWRGTYDVVTFTGSRYAACGPQIGYELGTAPECYPFTLAPVNVFGDVQPRGSGNTDLGPRSWTGSGVSGARSRHVAACRRGFPFGGLSGTFVFR